MPSINRVRIFNVSYDSRHIKDCCFDLYGGANTLFNLSNGGGKSVIVQLFFQPILPGTQLDKRKITDYLPKNYAPIHIMIEWLLDDTKEKQYLLTGICMGLNKAERSDSDDPGYVNYRYFTYTYNYIRGNAYDIEHFPLKDDDGRILSYDTIYDKLKKLNRTDFRFYPKSKLSEYKKELERYRIYQGEWMLLQKVNQHEGGLTDLFCECKTSDQLFDDWILKTVSDCMPEARSSLIQMISGLIQPMIDSREDLRQKELLERLSADTQRFMQCLNTYWNKLDEKEKKEYFFCGARNYERQKLQEAEHGREAAEQLQQKCKAEEKQIKLEQISENILSARKEKTSHEAELKTIELALPEAKRRLDAAEHQYRCMEAAKTYATILSWNNKLSAARSVIETLETGETGMRLRNIGYTLYAVYSEQADAYYLAAETHKKEIDKANDKEKLLREEKERCQGSWETYNKQIAALDVKCDAFLKEEEKYRALIGRLPQRDLFSNLVPEDIAEIREQLDAASEQAREALEALEAERNAIKQQAEACREEDRQLQKELASRIKEQSDAETALHLCEDEIEKIKIELKEHDIDEKYVFDKAYNLNLLKEKATAIAERHDKLFRKLHRKKETLDKLHNKQLHISRSFAELLEKNGISFQTGEDYLSVQPVEYLNRLLSENDMLPYCFIVDDVDYDKVLSIDPELTIDRICPVIQRSKIGEKLSLPHIRFYDLYNKESIDRQTSEGYEERLKADIYALHDHIRELEKQKDQCQSVQFMVSRFCYTEESYLQLKFHAENAMSSLNAVIQKRDENENKMQMLSEKLSQTKDRIVAAKEKCVLAEKKTEVFREYLDLSEHDLTDRAERRELSGMLEQIGDRLYEIGEELATLSSRVLRESIAQSECKHKGERAAEDASRFASYETGERIDAEPGQLETEYRELSANFSSDRARQENICREADEMIRTLSKELDEDYPELSEADYAIGYDRDVLVSLHAEQKKAQSSYTDLKNKKAHTTSLLRIVVKQLDTQEKELHRCGGSEPLPETAIKGNYDLRLDECTKMLGQARRDEEHFKQEARYHEKRITEMDKLIPDGIEKSAAIPLVQEVIDIPQHKANLSEIKSSLYEKKREVRKLCEEIKKLYADEDDMLVKAVIERIGFQDTDDSVACYYLYEQLDENVRCLNDEVQRLRSDLEHIEDSKQHMIKQVYEHGHKLYVEVMSIFKNSYEKLQAEKGRHKIMEIDIAEALDTQAERRIADFVSSELVKLCEEAESEYENPSKLAGKLSKVFSDRRIFDAIVNKSTYRIRVYKVNEIAANSRLEYWESVYSGGERFVTYFMLFAALTSYSRKSLSGESGDHSKSVFLSDNPFGATSSKHLLDALIKITQKYRLQLICFTALQQSSITNEFDLIYQLAMRQAAYSNHAYLKVEDVKKKEKLQPDSNLEYVSLKSSQLTLF